MLTNPVPTAPVALVTGAARRIGAAIAARLHAEGYTLALHCHASVLEAQALADQLNALRPGSAAVFAADLRHAEACAGLVTAVNRQLGAPSLLVNNASGYYATPVGSITAAAIDDLFASNARAPLLLVQAAVAAGALRGVVNLLDAHTRSQPRPGFAAYTAAKDALWALTELLALELAPAVRVNGVALGHIAAAVRAVPSEAELLDLADKALQLPRVPLARYGTETDAANAVAWLASEASSYLTGTVIPVDGGRRLA